MTTDTFDARAFLAPWDEIRRRTAASAPPGDPVFGRIFEGKLVDLFGELPERLESDSGVVVVFGPGSALVEHDLLWYADLPKREALTAVRRGEAANVGQPAGEPGSEQRLLFVDWPVLDRHKQTVLPQLDRYIDLSDAGTPRSLDGETLRRSLHQLAGRPFRTRPTFLPGPWGGQWLRDVLGISTEAPNLAWSYELITPESGILLGTDESVEVGFELLMAAEAERVLEPSSRSGSASRFRSGSTTWTPWAEATSQSSAIQPRSTCARHSVSRTRNTRPITSWRRARAR